VSDRTDSQSTVDLVDDLAVEILTDLYGAVCGSPPKAVRAYHDEDVLLLLLRFEPDEFAEGPDDTLEPLLDTAFLAMPGMIASAVLARTGRCLFPGNLSVSPERGLAVFAFNTMEAEVEECDDADLFRIDSEYFENTSPPALRLAS